MSSEVTLSIHSVLDNKIISVPLTATTTAEDVCIYVCKVLNIGTIARHLFALRLTGKQLFLMPSATFGEKQTSYDLRIRFKVARIANLKKIDIKAYDYYFHQARCDVLENKVPDIIYEKYRRELVGLGITDMYRVMLEKDLPRESVENEYKKYIPKEVIKRHAFFIKKPIHDTLGKLQKSHHDAWYVKAEYLKQLDIIAPEYLCEIYKAVTELEGSICNIYIKISPHQCGIKYSLESKRDQWVVICSIEEIEFVSIRNDGTVEISRKNGIPFYLKFNQLPVMLSFISLLDGYYRLMCKWTFNICKDVQTPSLQNLYRMKCHGPVGGEFSYAKLEEKRGNHPGCFIIRESESKYNHYFIDVCMKDSLKPKTFKLEHINDTEFIFNDDLTRYRSIHQLFAAYNDPNGAIYLHECLPPSEYDKSQLLLCHSEHLLGATLTDSSALTSIPLNSALCIDCKDIQVYKVQKKEGSKGITTVYRSMWKVEKSKKIEVAMKMLKPEYSDKHLKDFLDLASRWAFIRSSAIVRLYGITLRNVSMVLEYFRLGPLDQYLRDNKHQIKAVDLIEASSNLASALWHLEENGIVHGNIRCRKIMVNTHDENSFTVKLTDPGIHTSYASKEVHWIPVECYSNLDFAKKSTAADVWAFATTLWEIFMLGEEISPVDHEEAMRWYASGKILPKPPLCPQDIYNLMKECWNLDPHRRKQPQAVMRDISQILYQVYNSRRTHSYAKVFSKVPNGLQRSHGSLSTNSLLSSRTESTFVQQSDDLMNMDDATSVTSETSSFSGRPSQRWILNSQDLTNCEDTISCDFSNILSNFNFSTTTTSLDSISSMQSIFELDADCNVVLQGRIGQGFYGEVYRGTLEYLGDDEREPRQVAIKKLKSSAMSSGLQDFEREINIMKTLKHPNIVEILGVLREPEILLVMEFVHHGSLQSYLKINKDSLDINQLLKYANDIAKGMDYLSQQKIVHRDLAARNILVVDKDHVKISDFGLAQVIGAEEYYVLKTNRELPIKWYAPESLRHGKFSVRSDVWSYGVTMCEMFNYGEEPTLTIPEQDKIVGQEQQVLMNALESGARFPCPPMCTQVIYIRLIIPCWENDPHNRPTFSDLISETQNLLSHYTHY